MIITLPFFYEESCYDLLLFEAHFELIISTALSYVIAAFYDVIYHPTASYAWVYNFYYLIKNIQ
jgi:hypothetical protein